MIEVAASKEAAYTRGKLLTALEVAEDTCRWGTGVERGGAAGLRNGCSRGRCTGGPQRTAGVVVMQRTVGGDAAGGCQGGREPVQRGPL